MMFWWRKERRFDGLKRLDASSAFIIGNGPSLNGKDLTLLRGIPSFASNAIYLIFDKTVWRPDYYTCVDTAVLPNRAEEISCWTRKLKKTQFIFPSEILAHGDRVERRRVADLVAPRRNVCFYESASLDLESEEESFDYVEGGNIVRESMTVTIALMQMAVKLGAKNLYLIGCDTNYVVPKEARVLDENSNRVDKRIVLDADTDPNHFDSRYFGAGKVWHTPNTNLMIKHYEVAKTVCERRGVEVFNAGRGGKLEVFPRIELKEAVERARGER